MAALTGRSAFEESLISKAWRDESFRQKLVDNPDATIRAELDFDLPSDVEIKLIEEPEKSLYVVLPGSPQRSGGQLSDRDLDAAAGGGFWDSWWGETCSIPAFYCC